MPPALRMMGELDDRRNHAEAPTITSCGKRRQKQQPPQSPKTPAATSLAPPPSTATSSRLRRLRESPSASTSTTTTTSSTTSTAPSTWTMYENPCFCSSHFYPDHPLSTAHRHRRRHHHRRAPTPERPVPRDKYYHRKVLAPEIKPAATPVRERLGTVLEREKAMRVEAENVAEALRVELERERRRREDAERRAAKDVEEAARWKAEAERMQGQVRAAKERGHMQEQMARTEVAEAMRRLEEEKRKLQMQISVQSAAQRDPAAPSQRLIDLVQGKDQQHKVTQAEYIRPGSSGSTGTGTNLNPASTPCQPLKHQQPKRDASPASVENPHIRRGIIGFVEFPRVVGRARTGLMGAARDGGFKSSFGGPPKLECQKAQLRVLLKGGGKVTPVAGFPTATGTQHNLVM